MLMTDAMVGSHKPCLQISEDEVDDRQILFGNLGIATGGDGEVIVATLGEASITTPVISDDFCAGPNRSLNEVAKRLRATVRDNGEPNTTGVSPTVSRMLSNRRPRPLVVLIPFFDAISISNHLT